MRKRINITLESCASCPHVERFGRMARPYCKLSGVPLPSIPEIDSFNQSTVHRPTYVMPTWCPLPDDLQTGG